MAVSSSGRKIFLDSNIWLYAFIKGPLVGEKNAIAGELARKTGLVVSYQVINEVCTNLLRKGAFGEDKIREVIDDFFTECTVSALNQDSLTNASLLREKHDFSFWDSLLISAALIENVTTFYSEDMHDGMIVSGRMQIVNPFKSSKKGK